jgi:NAD(P)H dehydrogenase (quinone)
MKTVSKSPLLFSAFIFALAITAFVASDTFILPQLNAGGGETRVLIVYYSVTGNTEKMAYGVAEGAKSVAGIEVVLKKVADVTREEVETADGLILGSPVYYANMAAPMKKFIDDWFTEKITLFDKVGGAFATGGGLTAGRETTINSLLLAMLNNGMIVVGPLYEGWGTFGSSARTAPPDEGVNEEELNDARRLGERVARVALKIKQAS